MSDLTPDHSPAPLSFAPSRPLDEMQAAHADLLQRQRGLPAEDAAANAAFASDVAMFVQRAIASGLYLEGDRERQEAQTLIDYWVTRLIRRNRAVGDSTLADFDEALAPELPDDPCPYQGLQAFREQDSAFFFGRERAIEKLYARIQNQIVRPAPPFAEFADGPCIDAAGGLRHIWRFGFLRWACDRTSSQPEPSA